MPPDASGHLRSQFFGMLPPEFDGLASQWGWPAFRANQVREWVYGKAVADPARMSNLSKLDRQNLAERVDFATSTIATQQQSNDGTQKLLLTWAPSTSSGH